MTGLSASVPSLPAQHFLAQPSASSQGTGSKPVGSFIDAGGQQQSLEFAWDPSEYEQIFPPARPAQQDSRSALDNHDDGQGLPADGDQRSTSSEQEMNRPDMTSLAAADFDVDVRSGFCPPQQPLSQLAPYDSGLDARPANGYGRWEQLLQLAQTPSTGVRLAGDAAEQEIDGMRISASALRTRGRAWRFAVRSMPVLLLDDVARQDVRWVRRAHLVLAFLAHFYLHSQPAAGTVPLDSSSPDHDDQLWQQEENHGKFLDRIPASVAIPWAQASKQLGLPPILTYATTTLWNWSWHPCNAHGLAGVVAAASQGRAGAVASATSSAVDPIDEAVPGKDVGLAINETFTGLDSERWFYLGSLRVELCGVKALELMRRSLDEIFMSDEVAASRVTQYLHGLAHEIDAMATALARLRPGCIPEEFYWAIRPWFRGSDSSVSGRGWILEGVGNPVAAGLDGSLDYPRRQVAGPSAGQSSLIHALDAFLDVDHGHGRVRSRQTSPDARGKETFMERMMLYMPSHHRAFLTHLRSLEWEPDEDDEDDLLGCFDAEQLEAQIKAERDAQRGLSTALVDDDGGSEGDSGRKMHPLRAFVLHQRLTHPQVGQAYDTALRALKRLRDEHVKIVTMYVVLQARRPPPAHLAVGTSAANKMTVPASDSSAAQPAPGTPPPRGDAFENNSKDSTLVGTGGTPLVQFLKDCRTNTVDTMLSALKNT